MQIGATLPGEEAEALATLLVEFNELFTWKPSDMLGISKDVITHENNIDQNVRLITQKQRSVGEDKTIPINKEVGKC